MNAIFSESRKTCDGGLKKTCHLSLHSFVFSQESNILSRNKKNEKYRVALNEKNRA